MWGTWRGPSAPLQLLPSKAPILSLLFLTVTLILFTGSKYVNCRL